MYRIVDNSIVESVSGAIPDGKIPRDVFVCVLAGSICNMYITQFTGTTECCFIDLLTLKH